MALRGRGHLARRLHPGSLRGGHGLQRAHPVRPDSLLLTEGRPDDRMFPRWFGKLTRLEGQAHLTWGAGGMAALAGLQSPGEQTPGASRLHIGAGSQWPAGGCRGAPGAGSGGRSHSRIQRFLTQNLGLPLPRGRGGAAVSAEAGVVGKAAGFAENGPGLWRPESQAPQASRCSEKVPQGLSLAALSVLCRRRGEG